jgi:hypothetical protein
MTNGNQVCWLAHLKSESAAYALGVGHEESSVILGETNVGCGKALFEPLPQKGTRET